jgi:hypothetical protein
VSYAVPPQLVWLPGKLEVDIVEGLVELAYAGLHERTSLSNVGEIGCTDQ